jgi:hypothetical protein
LTDLIIVEISFYFSTMVIIQTKTVPNATKEENGKYIIKQIIV